MEKTKYSRVREIAVFYQGFFCRVCRLLLGNLVQIRVVVCRGRNVHLVVRDLMCDWRGILYDQVQGGL